MVIPRLFAQQQKGKQLGAELISMLTSGEYSVLTIVVAFLRSEGVQQLKDALEKFVASGKKAIFIVGISGKVTSYEGLKLLLEIVKGGYVAVFYNANSSAGIFHPKLYFFEGDKKVAVVIASNNLTEPGLFVNYELATIIELDPQKKEDQQLQAEVNEYIGELISNKETARQLTPEFLEELKDTGAVQIETKEPKTEEEAEEDAAAKLERSARQAKIKGLFGSAPVTSAPARQRKPLPKVPGTKQPAATLQPAATPQASVAAGSTLIMRAYKSRGTQVQVPMGTTFFAKGDRITSARSKIVRTINPAKSHGRRNTLKIEISESRNLDIPVIVFQKTGAGVEYTVYDGKAGEGARLLRRLEQGRADGSTRQTRKGSTLYRIE
jgi:HKD family nuclease